MKAMFLLTLTARWSIAVIILHKGNLCNATDASVTTSKGYSTYVPQADIGRKNLTQAVLIRDSITLNCTFDANVGHQILWWFNGSILFIGNESFWNEIANVQIEVNAKTSYLHIERFQPNNTGLYVCKRGKNETGLHAYVYIRRPITRLVLVFVNKSLTNPTYVTVKVNESYVFRCFGDEPSSHRFIWKIDDDTVGSIHTSPFNTRLYVAVDEATYFGSELLLHVEDKIKTITCQTGKHSTSTLIEVDSNLLPLQDFKVFPFVIGGIGGVALLVLFLASVCYCMCTCHVTMCCQSLHSEPNISSSYHVEYNYCSESPMDHATMKGYEDMNASKTNMSSYAHGIYKMQRQND